jgi:hypothetical protein
VPTPIAPTVAEVSQSKAANMMLMMQERQKLKVDHLQL